FRGAAGGTNRQSAARRIGCRGVRAGAAAADAGPIRRGGDGFARFPRPASGSSALGQRPLLARRVVLRAQALRRGRFGLPGQLQAVPDGREGARQSAEAGAVPGCAGQGPGSLRRHQQASAGASRFTRSHSAPGGAGEEAPELQLTGCPSAARGATASGPSAVLDQTEFFGLVDRLGPYETAPHVAVAVSGGPDSLALTLLLAEWVHRRGGRLQALTVDHGLRPESAEEAASVGRTLMGRGISHRVLKWSGTRPQAGLQEAAREARYALLLDWCSRAGILHLFLAHHLEDQVETFLMRIARGSGRSGLAGMSAIVERRGVRLLRPCLGAERDRLRATLANSGLVPLQAPSNQAPRFTRVRVRARLPALAGAGLGPGRLAA